MKQALFMVLLIGGAIIFLQTLWALLDRGVSLKQIAAFVVLYCVIELWLHKKGKVWLFHITQQ